MSRQRLQKGEIKDSTCRDSVNVGCKLYLYTGNNRGQWKDSKRFKEKFESHTEEELKNSLQNTAILGTSHMIQESTAL